MSKHIVFIRGEDVRVISEDPSLFTPLGEVVSADRLADVRPKVLDGKLVWVVEYMGALHGPFSSKQEALDYEVQLCRTS